jgi:hypothetical protein
MEVHRFLLSGISLAFVGCGIGGGPSLLNGGNSSMGSSTAPFSGKISAVMANCEQKAEGKNVCLDPQGNAYGVFETDVNIETGVKLPASTSDGAIIKYSADGTKLWAKNISTNGKNININAVKCAPDGSVYIVGSTTATLQNTPPGNSVGTTDMFAIRYEGNGSREWTRQMGVATKASSFNDASVDGDSNLYAYGESAGAVAGTLIGNKDGVVVKYAPDSTPVWSRQFGGANSAVHSGSIMAKKDGSAVYITGDTTFNFETSTAVAETSGFVGKLGDTGTTVWSKVKNTTGGSVVYKGFALNEDNGNLYVAAQMTDKTWTGAAMFGNKNGILVCYTDAGTTADLCTGNSVSSEFQSTTTKDIEAASVALSPGNDSAYIAGTTTSPFLSTPMVGNQDGFIVKVSTNDLSTQWTRHFGVPGEFTNAGGIDIDMVGNVVISGSSTGNTVTGTGDSAASTTEFYIRSFTPSGVLQ